MKKLGFVFIFLLSFVSCSKTLTKPDFINFSIKNDSIYVVAQNPYPIPLSTKLIQNKTEKTDYIRLNPSSDTTILAYSKKDKDTITILKEYTFKAYYGDFSERPYDSSFNYAFPFLKAYTSKIIQGYNGNFSHFGSFSAKTLDFDMKIGDTIVAARDGIVAKIMVKHNKQGTTEAFKKYGNYIMIYHSDNTFSQYVHLKQYGNLVEVGDSIKANQPIALSGFTGMTTVPHLHFGVYKSTKNGLVSIPVILDSIPAKTLKRGQLIKKN